MIDNFINLLEPELRILNYHITNISVCTNTNSLSYVLIQFSIIILN